MYYLDKCCCEEKYEPTHTYTFIGPCVKTGKEVSVTVPAEGLFKFRQGEYIQNAFPELSTDDREFLISGLSKEGWDLAFPPEEEFEEEEIQE